MKTQIVELLCEHGVLSTAKLINELQHKENKLAYSESREANYVMKSEVFKALDELRDEGKIQTNVIQTTRFHELTEKGRNHG